jgi:hypothetical protein
LAGKNTKLSFTVSVERSAQRFRELIVYISKRSVDDPHFGATKLNKILYYSDFKAFERFGVPLSGVSYFRLKAGPAPKALLPIRRELENERAIRVERITLSNGFEQHRTIALREPILEHFTTDELQIVDEVIHELWQQNATEVSDASHDVRWRVLCDRDTMPYEFAFLSNEKITAEEVERTRELAKQFGW